MYRSAKPLNWGFASANNREPIMERKPRAIRLNEQEWTDFKGLLGTVWLRKQIARAVAKDQRKPTAHKAEE